MVSPREPARVRDTSRRFSALSSLSCYIQGCFVSGYLFLFTCLYQSLCLICFARKRLACSRPSVGGAVRRAAGERGKNEEGLGREDTREG